MRCARPMPSRLGEDVQIVIKSGQRPTVLGRARFRHDAKIKTALQHRIAALEVPSSRPAPLTVFDGIRAVAGSEAREATRNERRGVGRLFRIDQLADASRSIGSGSAGRSDGYALTMWANGRLATALPRTRADAAVVTERIGTILPPATG